MKSKIILLCSTLAFCAFLVTPARAQGYGVSVVLGGTNNVAAATTNSSFATVIPATRATDIAVQPSFKLTGSGTSAVVLKFDESADNANWTANAVSISVTAAGTATVSKVSNFALGGIGYLRLSTVENPNASAVTNLSITFAQKRER
jgi:hypothetical protein